MKSIVQADRMNLSSRKTFNIRTALRPVKFNPAQDTFLGIRRFPHVAPEQIRCDISNARSCLHEAWGRVLAEDEADLLESLSVRSFLFSPFRAAFANSYLRLDTSTRQSFGVPTLSASGYSTVDSTLSSSVSTMNTEQ